jgi:hypothetical protein
MRLRKETGMSLEPWKYTEEIDEKIEDILSAMSVEGPTSEEYPKLVRNLHELIKLREQPKEPEVIETIVEIAPEPKAAWWHKIDWTQVIVVTGNIAAVVILARVEKDVFINPKALGMLHKPKPQPFR